MSRNGSNDFVNLTLTEFLMVIVFLLLSLLLYSFEKQKEIAIDGPLTPEEIEQLESNATRFSAELFHQPAQQDGQKEKIFQFIRLMDQALDNATIHDIQQKNTLPELWDTLIANQREAAAIQKKINDLMKSDKKKNGKVSVDDLVNAVTKQEKELVKTRREVDKYRSVAKKHFDTSSPDQMGKAVADLKGSYRNLADRAHKDGFGNPLCWTEADGKIEFLFSIIVMENGMFQVEPIQPEHRMEDIKRIGYANPVTTVLMTENEFKERMQRFWDFGQRNNACRFFVRVTDNTTTKERWKRGLELIESFFYKVEVQ